MSSFTSSLWKIVRDYSGTMFKCFYFDFLQALQRLSVSACNELTSHLYCLGLGSWSPPHSIRGCKSSHMVATLFGWLPHWFPFTGFALLWVRGWLVTSMSCQLLSLCSHCPWASKSVAPKSIVSGLQSLFFGSPPQSIHCCSPVLLLVNLAWYTEELVSSSQSI